MSTRLKSFYLSNDLGYDTNNQTNVNTAGRKRFLQMCSSLDYLNRVMKQMKAEISSTGFSKPIYSEAENKYPVIFKW